MKMNLGLVGLAALMLTASGVALATASPIAAQVGSGPSYLPDYPLFAKQNGRTVASTRSDARGGFRFDLAPGAYDICVGLATALGAGIGGSAPQTRSDASDYNNPAFVAPAGSSPTGTGSSSPRLPLPDQGPRIPGNGGRAGRQALGGAGAPAGGCFPYTVTLPGANGTTRTEAIPVRIRQPDGTILIGLLAGMRINDAPGGGSDPVSIPTPSTRPTIPDAASGAAVREPGGSGGCTPGSPIPGGTANPCAPAAIVGVGAQLLANDRFRAEGRGDRRVDPRIPPPAVAAPRTVTVTGTLSLER